ncbi:MAG: vWA domain-containing protein [Bdellovibrionota bacterium]
MDIEETIEEAPLINLTTHDPDGIWMDYTEHRKQKLILTIDTSLSMTGEKLALTAVALAVVLLQFPDDQIGVVAFENSAEILKFPDQPRSIECTLEKFLNVPAQGYTHLEEGLKTALMVARNMKGRRPLSTILLTDGKYTAGRDPAYLAPGFQHLVVMKMGGERASLPLCIELAKKGKGRLYQVEQLESLPEIMYGVVKSLLRGHSH